MAEQNGENQGESGRGTDTWWMRANGRETGPLTLEALRIRLRLAPPATEVRQGDAGPWRPLDADLKATLGVTGFRLPPLPNLTGRIESPPKTAGSAPTHLAETTPIAALPPLSAPDAESAVAELLAAARQAEFEGRVDDAVARYRQALELAPADTRAFVGLESLYRVREAWSALAALYRGRLNLAADIKLQVRLALVLSQRMRDHDGAVRLLEAAVEAGAGRMALEPLANLLGQAERHADALAVADALLALGGDRAGRAQWLEQTGAWLEALGDGAGAAQRLFAAWEATPDDLDRAFAARAALPADAEQSARLDLALLDRLDADDPRRVAVGETHARRLAGSGRDDEALAQYRAVLSLAPEHAEARAFVAARLVGAGDQVGLAQLRLDEALAIADPVTRLAALRGLAEWAEEEVPAAAGRVWRAVVALRPQDAMAQAALAGHLAATQDWTTQVEVLIERLGHTRGEGRRRALYLEIAEIFERRLDQPEAAYAALAEAFGETLDDAGMGPGLGRVARRAGRMTELVALYERTLDLFEEGAPITPLLARVGRWRAEDLRDFDGGLKHLSAALTLSPGDDAAVDGLLALAQLGHGPALAPLTAALEAAGDFERLYAVARRCIELHPRGAARAQALSALATLCESHADRLDEALAWREEALVEDPADANLVSELRRLSAALEAPEAVADALERAATAAKSSERARLARAWAAERVALGDDTGAAAAWRMVLATEPGAADALTALDDFATGCGDDTLLIEILGQRLLASGGAARARIAERLAEACARAGDADGELRALRAWVGGDPRGAAGRRRLAVRLWAQNDARGTYEALRPLADADDPEAQLLVATLCAGPLARHAEAAHRAQSLLRSTPAERLTPEDRTRLLAVLSTVGDAENACVVLAAALAAGDGDAADLQIELARRLRGAEAISHWEAVLDARPSDAEALAALDAIYAEGAPEPAHLAVLDARVARALVHEAETAIDLIGRRAALRSALGDTAGAIADWQRVLAARPDAEAALAALDALFEIQGRSAERADIVARRVALAVDGCERLVLWQRLAQLDAGPRGEAALAAIEGEATDAATRDAATEARVSRLLSRDAVREAVAALDAAAARQTERSKALAFGDRATTLLGELEGEAVAAFARWLNGLSTRHADSAFLARLGDAARAANAWGQLVLEADTLAATLGANALISLAVQTATWVGEHRPGGQAEAAARLMALLASPDRPAPAAEQALLRLLDAQVAVDTAGPLLAARFAHRRATGEHQRVLRLLAAHGTGAARREAQESLAKIAAEAGRDTEALEWRRQVFLQAPADEAAEAELVAQATANGAFAALAETYRAGMAEAPAEVVRRLGHRALDLLRGRVNDPMAADEVAALILMAVADDADALKHLTPRLRNQGHHEPLAMLLDAAVEACTAESNGTRRLRLRFEAGEAHSAAGNGAAALRQFEAVLAEVPDHADALDRVEALRAEAGDAVGLYALMGQRARSAPADATLRVRCARLAESLGMPTEAIEWWQAAIDLGADEATALAALDPLLVAEGSPRVLADVLERRRRFARDEKAILGFDRRLGALYAALPERASDALGCYTAVLRRAPDDLEALRAARNLHAQVGDPGGRAQIEARLLALLPPEHPERAELQRALARTCEQLDRNADALTAWRAVWRQAPADTEAEAAVLRLAKAGGDRVAQAEVLGLRAERLAKAGAEPSAQAAVWLALVDLHEAEPEGLEAAREACRAAANLAPDDHTVLTRLESLHVRAKAHADRAWLLTWRLENESGSAAARASLSWRLAQVQAEDLSDPAEATATLARLLDWAPTAGVVAALADRAQAAEAWPVAVAALETSLDSTFEPTVFDPAADALGPALSGQARRLLAADWRARHLHDPEGALELASAALEAEPQSIEAQSRVESLLVRLTRWEDLVAHLAPADDASPTDARMAWIAVARVHEKHRRDAAAAREVFDRLLGLDAHDTTARDAVERLSAQLDDWAGLAERVRSHADALSDPDAKAERLVRLSDLYAGPLSAPAAALAACREALNLRPEHAGAQAQFEALCLKTGHLDLLNGWYAERMGRTSGDEARVLVRKRAEVQARIEQRTATPAAAQPEVEAPSAPPRRAGARRPALNLATVPNLDAPHEGAHGAPTSDAPAPQTTLDSPAGDDPATRALEAAYRAEGRFAELAALYRRRLAVMRNPAAIESIEAALLDLYLGPADEPGRAAAMLRPRLAHEKRPRFLLQQLVDLYARAEDWPACADMLKAEVELADLRDADRLPLFDRLARVCLDGLGDRARAAGWWRAALEFDPDFAPARQGIAELSQAAEADAEKTARANAPKRPARAATGATAVRTFTVRAKNPARRRQLLRAAAAVGVFWALVATAAFIIQSMRLDRTSDEIQTATRAYDRLAREVNATQTEFTQVARVLHNAHGTGDTAELFATDDVPVGEQAADTPMMDRVLSMAINNLKMRNAVTNVGSVVANVVEQREAAKVQAEQFASKIEGMQSELAQMSAAKGVADEMLARRLDENIEQVEVALGFTGLDLDAVGVPSADALAASEGLSGADALTGTAAGGPWQAATVNYASPLPGMGEVMSGFGWRGKEHHNGIDIPGEVGDPVRAVGEGEVIFVQSRASWEARAKFIERDGKRIKSPGWRAGVYVELKHPDGRVSRYLHLDDVAPGIEAGVRVRKRQVIGTLGRTAVEHSATHLHFELREAGEDGGRWGSAINPETPLSVVSTNAFMEGANRLKAETSQLTRALGGGETFGAIGQGLEEAPEREAEVEANVTADILASLGTQGRVKRMQDLEKLLRSLPLVAPVDNFKVSSGFGKRNDPMDPHIDGFHTGIDIPGEERTEVLATAPGVVTFSGWQGGFGRMVEIDHGNGVKTRYGHLYKSLVPVGQTVAFREKVGQMGNTGRSTGVHLHYEIVVNDEPVDPMRYMRAGRALASD